MKISKAGIKLIEHSESFQTCPYLCPALVPTIGYGTTHIGERQVTMEDHCISRDTASYILRTQVDEIYGKAVNHYVRVPITQNQFDALVSFAYNLGTGALKNSTLLKRINNKYPIGEITSEFHKWTHVNGKVSRGLEYRRNEEAKVFIA